MLLLSFLHPRNLTNYYKEIKKIKLASSSSRARDFNLFRFLFEPRYELFAEKEKGLPAYQVTQENIHQKKSLISAHFASYHRHHPVSYQPLPQYSSSAPPSFSPESSS